MEYFKHIIIGRDENINGSNKNVDPNKCYKIKVCYLDDKEEEASGLSFDQLLGCIKDLEDIYKCSFAKLVDCKVVSISDFKTEEEVMNYLEATYHNKGINYRYGEKSDFVLHIEPKAEDRYKYLLYIIDSDYGKKDYILVDENQKDYILVDENQKDIVVDIFKKTHNLNHYSFDKLIEDGRIVSFDSAIDKLTVFSDKDCSTIKVEYSNGKIDYLDISMFSILVNKLLKENSNYKNPFYRLYKDGRIDFGYGAYENLYEKNISSIKIKSDGDVLVKSKKMLPFARKYNIMKQPKKVLDVISSFCYRKKINRFSDLVGKKIIFKTVKSNQKVLPNQIIAGRCVDTSVNPGVVNYKYYALYENDYQEITKGEAVEYFNSIAKKNKVYEIDDMFSKGYCKVMPINNVLDYVKNTIQNGSFGKKVYNKRKGKEDKFNKIGRFVKKVTRKFFGTPLKKAVAITIAVCVAGVGVVSSMFSKKTEFKENSKSSYGQDTNSDIGSLESFNSANLVVSNDEYNDLLDKCIQNNDRKNSMEKIGSYLEVYNHENNMYSHSFDEVFYEYLAYNSFSEIQFNNVLGDENLDINKFSQVLNYAMFKDAVSHKNQTEAMDKTMIINSTEGQKFYQKYEDLFIEMNKTDDRVKKLELGHKFYDMARKDLPKMASGRYEDVPQYMYIIEEFRQAMEFNESMSFENKFTDYEEIYIKGILDNVIVCELERAISCKQVSDFVDEYYGNKTVDTCPAIEEFRETGISRLNVDKESSSVEKEKTKVNNSKEKKKVEAVVTKTTESNSYTSLNGADVSSDCGLVSEGEIEKINDEDVSSDCGLVSEGEIEKINDEDVFYGEVVSEETKGDISEQSYVCVITDHNFSSVGEGFIDSDDMKIIYEDSDGSSIDNVLPKDEVQEEVNLGVNGEVDYYENVTTDFSGSTPYNPNDPLPNPEGMSNEEFVSSLVEMMSNPSDESNDKLHVYTK